MLWVGSVEFIGRIVGSGLAARMSQPVALSPPGEPG